MKVSSSMISILEGRDSARATLGNKRMKKKKNNYVGALIYADDCRRADASQSYINYTIDRRKCKKDVIYLEFDSFSVEKVMSL